MARDKSSRTHLQNAKLTNSTMLCDVSGCSEYRTTVARYCSKHRKRYMRYGHPEGRAVRAKEWAVYARLIVRLLDANLEHPGVKTGLEWIAGQLKAARSGEKVAGWRELSRLAIAGVTPWEMLIAAASAFALSHFDSRAVPNDMRRVITVGRALSLTSPRARRVNFRTKSSYSVEPSPTAVRDMGKRFIEVLGRLLVNIACNIETVQDQQAQVAAYLAAPFTPPAVAMLNETPKQTVNQPLPFLGESKEPTQACVR